jgi:hypothetical protein
MRASFTIELHLSEKGRSLSFKLTPFKWEWSTAHSSPKLTPLGEWSRYARGPFSMFAMRFHPEFYRTVGA